MTCLAENVPETDNDIFVNVPRHGATLYVPSKALEKYKLTAPWSEFGTILPLEDTAIKDVCYNSSNSVIFKINGQKAKDSEKGIIIRDGKKYINK